MDQKKIWDDLAYSKEFTTPLHSELLDKYLDKEAHILDVGCGYGRTLDQLQKLGYTNLFGIDFSEKMIERAKAQFPSLNVNVQRNKTLNFPDNTFDAVFLFAVLTCITTDEEQEFLLNESKRILKPGGIIYINDFLLNEDERNCSRYDCFYKKYKIYGIFELPEGLTLRHHSMEWIKKCISPFKCMQFKTTSFPTMNGHFSNAYYFIGKK